MTANRQTPTSGPLSGANFATDVAEEIAALWDGVTSWIFNASGANTITGTVTPPLTAYAKGQRFMLQAVSDNTGPVTININGVGALSLLEADGSAVASGRVLSGSLYEIISTGSDLRLVGQPVTVNGLNEVAVYRYKKDDGLDSGTTIQGPPEDYPFNDEVSNSISGASLDVGTGTVTLPIGDYDVDGMVIIYNAEAKTQLYDPVSQQVFAAVVTQQGGGDGDIPHLFSGVISITQPTQVRLRTDVTTGISNRGLGRHYTGLSVEEEFGWIKFRRIHPFAANMQTVAQLGIGVASDATKTLIARGDESQFEAKPTVDGGTGNHIQYRLAENAGGLKTHIVEEEVTLSGASTNTTFTVPSGALLMGASGRVTETITGCASFTAGTSQDFDEFETGIGLAVDTTFSQMLNDPKRTTSNTLEFTAVGAGGTFTAGKIRVTAFYHVMQAPAS